jgi:hypothetical protein
LWHACCGCGESSGLDECGVLDACRKGRCCTSSLSCSCLLSFEAWPKVLLRTLQNWPSQRVDSLRLLVRFEGWLSNCHGIEFIPVIRVDSVNYSSVCLLFLNLKVTSMATSKTWFTSSSAMETLLLGIFTCSMAISLTGPKRWQCCCCSGCGWEAKAFGVFVGVGVLKG